MSILEQLKKLDKQRDQLLASAKAEALKSAQDAIADLNALGFNYQLVEASSKSRRTRRSGIRQNVLTVIQKHPSGITRAEIITAFSAKGDAATEQSISNALSALRKQEKVNLNQGKYTT